MLFLHFLLRKDEEKEIFRETNVRVVKCAFGADQISRKAHGIQHHNMQSISVFQFLMSMCLKSCPTKNSTNGRNNTKDFFYILTKTHESDQ